MSTQPAFESVDNYTGDLLDLMADTNHPSPDFEWAEFRTALAHVARTNGGVIDQNRMRPLTRGVVAPRRTGAFYRRACLEGLIAPTGDWSVSDDTEGRNAGRPMRTYRYLAGAR